MWRHVLGNIDFTETRTKGCFWFLFRVCVYVHDLFIIFASSFQSDKLSLCVL